MAIKYDLVDDVIVFIMKGAATDPEWDEYIRFLKRTIARMEKPRALVIGDNGPSPRQRAQMEAVIRPYSRDIRVSVVTTSTFVRGLVGAISLFFPAFRAFDPKDITGALAHVDFPPSRAPRLISHANTWCAEIGLPALPLPGK